MIRVFAILLSLAFLSASNADTPAKPHIVLVGDSTVTDNAGWGLGFRQFLADGVKLTNTSRGGRSSMSFIKEGSWEKALALKGDYYLIQFGHNDEPGKPGRSTTMEEYRSYMNQYVDDVRAAKATPVLVTSLVRRQFKDKNDPHKIDSSLNVRAEVVREIAKEKKVPLIELHDRSKELCEKLGREGCLAFSPTKEKGEYDGTHLNENGYVLFGRIVAEELRKAVPDLSPLILSEPRNASPVAGEKTYDAVVAFDGSGTQTTIQAAIDAAPTDATVAKPHRILVKSGVYKEHVVIPSNKPFIQLLGEPGEAPNTVISMATNVKTPDPANSGKLLSAENSSTILITASDFTARNLTFENTTTLEGRVQALACFITGDRTAYYGCRFIGWQDTLRPDAPNGRIARHYFRDCEITGHVDFIYSAGTAVFDRCHIHCRADGYITAASTPASTPYGFVFLDCKITTAPEVKRGVFLGRPWRPDAAVAFIRCDMQDRIVPEGWHNWGNPENEKSARYSEYRSTGPGARPEARVPWAHQLSDGDVPAYTAKNILGGTDGWNPGTP
ncbi:MAG: pectinesterase family protein [Luteolibacter sp.]|uniref:pectinesterase family protein n=1 Tax=Luteolibacter sp. TaxID=1962973 RepID=UPI003266AB38